jgi:propanol-preferring alcohol dehydrogenase
MQAMLLATQRLPLKFTEVPTPRPQPDQVLLQIKACAVCRTDLHVVDGELPEPKLPLIPGHEVVGVVSECGANAHRFQVGQRVGVPWLGWTCGECPYCRSSRENLCERARFTGYTLDGGYAEYMVADERFCFPIPQKYSDAEAAPLLCAGLIGYRALSKTGDAKKVGIYGFGAAAHIITQVARFQRREIYAFTRPCDEAGQQFARSVGAVWAGSSTELPPVPLDAAILFAPIGAHVPLALRAVGKGGIVVCGGIHMSDIPSFAYELLWQERTICSVANLTRKDGQEFFALAPQVPIKTTVHTFPLRQANQALESLRQGKIKGAAVLLCAETGSRQ